MKAKSKRPVSKHKGERAADLLLWFGDGHCGGCSARVAADTEISIGRTNSKRALGFIVSRGATRMDFVLDRDQVAELAAFLEHIAYPGLLKPLGRKGKNQLSLVATMAEQQKRKPER